MAHCKRCDRFSYFKFDSDGICSACHAKDAKLAEVKRFYAERRAAGKLSLRFAVINLHWRQRFSVDQVAEILGETVEVIDFQLDCALQDAQ